MTTFRRFWLTTLLPLALALPLLVNATWEVRVMAPTQPVLLQRGFPFPAVTDSVSSSATPLIFILPLLLNWAFALLWVTVLGRWLWPRLSAEQQKGLRGTAWLLLLLALPLTALTFGLARWHWVSPHPVLERLGVRPHFFIW